MAAGPQPAAAVWGWVVMPPPPPPGKPQDCPGSPLCLWPGSGDRAVTQGTATKGPSTRR